MSDIAITVGLFHSDWLQSLGVETWLKKKGFRTSRIASMAAVSGLTGPQKPLVLLLPTITDDRKGGFRLARLARAAAPEGAQLKTLLIGDKIDDSQRRWAAKHGADSAFALYAEQDPFLDFINKVQQEFAPSETPAKKARFPDDFLAYVKEHLEKYVDVDVEPLFRAAIPNAETAGELCYMLSQSIVGSRSRTQFLLDLQGNKEEGAIDNHDESKSIASKNVVEEDQSISSQVQILAEARLAGYIGAAARKAVTAELKRASTRRQFFDRLAEYISDPIDQERFLQNLMH